MWKVLKKLQLHIYAHTYIPHCVYISLLNSSALTSDSVSVLLPSVCSLESNASGDTCPTIPSEDEEKSKSRNETKRVKKHKNS